MSPQTVDGPDPLADEIRRQLGSAGLTRYLSSLPAFAVDPGMPERLRDLFAELQRAEAARPRRRGKDA